MTAQALSDFTDETGAYTLNGITAGTGIAISAVRTGYQGYSSTVDVAAGATTQKNFTMTSGSGSVYGTVTGTDGTKLAGIKVLAGELDTMTQQDGTYRIDGIPVSNTETRTITARDPNKNYRNYSGTIEVAPGISTQHDFMMQKKDAGPTTGGLMGMVKNCNDEPVDGALITITGTGTYTAHTDAGQYEITGIMPGTVTVKAEKEGYIPVEVTGVEIVKGLVTTIETIIMTCSASSIEGCVAYIDCGIEGVTVTLSQGSKEIGTFTTDCCGMFDCGLLPAGTYTLACSVNGSHAAGDVVVRPDAPAAIVLFFEERALNPAPTPDVTGCTSLVVDSSGYPHILYGAAAGIYYVKATARDPVTQEYTWSGATLLSPCTSSKPIPLSLDVDSQNNVHACYWNPRDRGIYYGKWAAAGGTPAAKKISMDAISDFNYETYEISLTAGPDTIPWISFYWKDTRFLSLPYKLWYGKPEAGSTTDWNIRETWVWPWNDIKAYDDIGLSVFLDNTPCVLYSFNNLLQQKNLWYQKLTDFASNTWSESKVQLDMMPDTAAIAVDPFHGDVPNVVYSDSVHKQILYALGSGSKETPTWAAETIGTFTDTASSAVIALDGGQANNVHMAYIEDGTIWYIWKNPGSSEPGWTSNNFWFCSEELNTAAGISLSLKAPAAGQDNGPHMAGVVGGALKCFMVTGRAVFPE